MKKLLIAMTMTLTLITMTSCDIDLSNLPKLSDIKIPLFMREIDQRFNKAGDILSVTTISTNKWKDGEMVLVNLTPFMSGNSFIESLGVLSFYEIGHGDNYKMVAKTLCYAGDFFSADCVVINSFQCMLDGNSVRCMTLDGNEFMPEADRTIDFIPQSITHDGFQGNFRITTCNFNQFIEPAIAIGCSRNTHSVILNK